MEQNPRIKDVVISTLLVTPSGALSPGLLSAAAVASGATLGALGGLMVSLGHVAVELPYLLVLTTMLSGIRETLLKYKKILSLIVLAFATFFAYGLVSGGGVPKVTVTDALLAGIFFTASNVYFLLWWVTVGLPLVEMASASKKHFVTMYLSHVWMDFAWLTLLSVMGKALFVAAMSKLFNVALAMLMMLFAVDITLKSFIGKGFLPS